MHESSRRTGFSSILPHKQVCPDPARVLQFHSSLSIWPSPVPNMQRINAVLISLSLCLNLQIQQLLSNSGTLVVQAWNTINCIHGQAVSISLVANSQLKRSVNVALLLVSTNVNVGLTGSFVGETVNEPWVGVEVEDDGAVVGEDGCVLGVRQTVRVVDA